MKNNLEIEDNDIEITSLNFIPYDAIYANIETWFDVDKKFKTDTRENLEWVDVFCLYFYQVDEMKILYFVSDNMDIGETQEYSPSENEKRVLLDKLTAFCQSEHKCSLMELIKKENKFCFYHNISNA